MYQGRVQPSLWSRADIFFRAPSLRRDFVSATSCPHRPSPWICMSPSFRSAGVGRRLPAPTPQYPSVDRAPFQRTPTWSETPQTSLTVTASSPLRFTVPVEASRLPDTHDTSQQSSRCAVCDGIDYSGTNLSYSFLTALIVTFL